jgi:hypothetical protein
MPQGDSKVIKVLKALKHFVAHLEVQNGGQRAGAAGRRRDGVYLIQFFLLRLFHVLDQHLLN